jgi:hypothetical protein
MTEPGEFVSTNKPGHSGAENQHLFGRALLDYRFDRAG